MTTPDYATRPATQNDVPQLIELVKSSIRGFGSNFYDDAQMESSLEHLYGIDRQLIDDGTYYVVVHEGSVIAAGGWSFRRTRYGGDQVEAARDANHRDPRLEPAAIRAFYVHPEHKRRGLGRRLHSCCEAAARDAGFRKLELLSTEMGAVFYRELGYTLGETEHADLPDGVSIPIIHMVKPIEGTGA
ncbi:MAG: GNAT family N-acetyltransferase [Acidobacteria bacterium]|nr:GNAT family N-acetyltransferase [Acidobacteriota bacterium]